MYQRPDLQVTEFISLTMDEETCTKLKRKRQTYGVPKGSPLEYPPCKVCGGKGSGKHYGVFTCQSCKTFYRRYLKKDKPYKCHKDGKCEILNTNRGNCSACRIKKCTEVGMCVEGVRIGRCTLEERNRTIQAVNEIETETRIQTRFERLKTEISQIYDQLCKEFPNGHLIYCAQDDLQYVESSNVSDLVPALAPNCCINFSSKVPQHEGIIARTVKEVIMENTEKYVQSNDIEQMNFDMELCHDQCPIDDHYSAEVSAVIRDVKKPSAEMILDLGIKSLDGKEFEDADDVMTDFYPLSPVSLEECFRELMEWTDQESDYYNTVLDEKVNDEGYEEERHFVEDLTDSFKEMMIQPQLSDEQIKAKLKDEYEKFLLLRTIIGPMAPMSNQEFKVFFSTTGLDIDGRLAGAQRIIGKLKRFIKKIINFAHKVPGIKDLSISDQINLLRASTFDFNILIRNRAVDPDLEVCMFCNGDVLHSSQWTLWSVKSKKLWFQNSKAIQHLNLSMEEMSLFLAISLTFSDRCTLEQPQRVDEIQLGLVTCLQTLLQARYKEKASLQFCKIFSVLVDLRTFSEDRRRHLKIVFQDEFIRKHIPSLIDLDVLLD